VRFNEENANLRRNVSAAVFMTEQRHHIKRGGSAFKHEESVNEWGTWWEETSPVVLPPTGFVTGGFLSNLPSLLSLVTTEPIWRRVGHPWVALRTMAALLPNNGSPNKEVGVLETSRNDGEVGLVVAAVTK